MRSRIVWVPLVLWTACTLTAQTNAQEASRSTLAALYQNEMAQAVRDLNWKGPKLSDNTLLAVCACGVSWMPKWQSPPLFEGKGKRMRYADAKGRLAGYLAATQSDNQKLAVPYALSLALDPDDLGRPLWSSIHAYLGRFDDDYDDVLVGIEEAPRDLPILSLYQYAAADLLVWRASPRLIPFLLTMASSGDAYLRSRAIAALGVAAYDPSTSSAQEVLGILKLKAGSISANQRRMVTYTLRRAVTDDNYRVRAAAAFALGLAGGQEDIALLKMLGKDRAYTVHPVDADSGTQWDYDFPVRREAYSALSRLGEPLVRFDLGTTTEPHEVPRMVKGCRNVTRDMSGMRKDEIRNVPSVGQGLW